MSRLVISLTHCGDAYVDEVNLRGHCSQGPESHCKLVFGAFPSSGVWDRGLNLRPSPSLSYSGTLGKSLSIASG